MSLREEELVRRALTRLSLGEESSLLGLLALEALLEGDQVNRELLELSPHPRPVVTGERARAIRAARLPLPKDAILTPWGKDCWKEK